MKRTTQNAHRKRNKSSRIKAKRKQKLRRARQRMSRGSRSTYR